MSKLQVYSNKGTKSAELELPKSLIAKPNENLMAQAFHVFEDRSHKGTSKVKTRAEVNKSTRKIYKQKGTGGARHGDRKAPIFAGGGIAHGPKGIKRKLKISKKLNKLALKMFLTEKANNNAICFVSNIDSVLKTKDAALMLSNIYNSVGNAQIKRTLVILGNDKKNTLKYFRNIKDVKLVYWKDLNLMEVYLSTMIVIDKDVLQNESNDKEVKKVVKSEPVNKKNKVSKKPNKVKK